jgi:hypothetical protein
MFLNTNNARHGDLPLQPFPYSNSEHLPSTAALTGVGVCVIIGFALRGRLTVGQLTLDLLHRQHGTRCQLFVARKCPKALLYARISKGRGEKEGCTAKRKVVR